MMLRSDLHCSRHCVMRPFVSMKYSVLLLLLTLAGCTAQPTVTSWLDPVSVATITAQTDPLVFVRVTSSYRIQKAFAQLQAIEINRMGDRRLYLVLTQRISKDGTPDQVAGFERAFSQVEIRADDRSVTLTRYTGNVSELGIGQPALLLPIVGPTYSYYPLERADLQAMAKANRVELVALGLSTPSRYEEWMSKGRPGLSDFLSRLPGDSSVGNQAPPVRRSGR